ncbi:transporter [Geothrix oryzisoli]|uniref:transporter n=1 Tax=Geothrix oryzisoli TaxID=2922721 RepID=UPI001FAE708A|nr:transporter [Geothrix oryzisoli]
MGRPPDAQAQGGRWRGPLLAGLLGASLLAGPPFSTDDPEPVEYHHMELYLSWLGLRTPGGATGSLPLVEFNDGILPETQFHIVAPLAYAKPAGGPVTRGYGDTEIGLKVRVLRETDMRPQVGVFPLVEVPTGAADRGLGAGHTQVYLPIWLQKSWGSWTSYGGYGWWRNPGDGRRNWHYLGWLLQRDLSGWATVGGEVFRRSPATLGGRASEGFNLGAIFNLSERDHLLVSAGRNLSGDRETHLYLGYQVTLDLEGARLRPSQSRGGQP